MKISDSIHSAYANQTIASTRSVQEAAAQQVRSKFVGDRVEISSRAHAISKALDTIMKMPDVDLDKVSQVKAMVENGTYRIDSRKIASKMVDESLLKEL